MKPIPSLLATSAVTATLLAALAPAVAHADRWGHKQQRPITVYFTRHAEKKTTTTPTDMEASTYELEYFPGMVDDDGDIAKVITDRMDDSEKSKGKNRDDVCGTSKCAEELNALGLARADLLADWLERRRVTHRLDAVYSSHKYRTFQTVDPSAVKAGLVVEQLPADGTELEPESTSPSECPTLQAILEANPGDTLLVAGHSGTLYDIMGTGVKDCTDPRTGEASTGLGLDTANDRRFPKDDDDKVRDFGDLWKVVIRNGQARFVYRVNLQPKYLFIENKAF